MSDNAFRKAAAVVLLLGMVLVDFTSRILSVGIDLLLAVGVAMILWPMMFNTKA
ncbi:DUF3927 family protein [Oceanimonas pelagia]|uniref:DUF3927 family protein n=1 Tax=Oceanimonas pelagia TaxID=3028314 RepID=A0AA50KM26_9GAMM|nr:DUF3927 family protein [Oceanimonas pelagia]WMC09561.1 DUF3927 family protein [Oceanimonas pelagia]